MSYIGNTPTQQNFVAGADQFSGNGSTVAFTLSRSVNTVFDIFVTVANVPQDPFTAYTVSGNTLTFDGAPPSGTNNIDVVYRATNVQTFVPTPGVSTQLGLGSASAPSLTFIGDTNTGIYSPGADTVAIGTGGTEALRVDSARNMGLGVTPAAWRTGSDKAFQIGAWMGLFTDSGVTSEITYNTYVSSSNTFVRLNTGSATRYRQYLGAHDWFTAGSSSAGSTITFGDPKMTLDASGLLAIGRTSAWDSNAVLTLQKSGVAAQVLNSTTNTVTLVNVANGNDSVAYSGTASNHPYYFITNNTEAARIDTSRTLLIGTTTQIRGTLSNTLQIQSSTNGQIVMRHSAQTAGRYWYMGIESSNDVFFIYPDGAGGVYMTRGATSWTGNSDERLKTDLKPIENAAQKISQLRTVTGRFKTDEENVSRAFLIAQDVQAVLPEAVDTKDDEDGTLGIRYTDTIPLLVAAIKELKAEIDLLKGNA